MIVGLVCLPLFRSGPPPPPPPPGSTVSSIIVSPVSPSSSSSFLVGGIDSRKFSSVLKHQFDATNLQVEHGLLTVKRTCNFVETILKSLEHSSDAIKLTAELQSRWREDPPLQDVTAQYVYACTMAEQVMIDTYHAHETFRRTAQSECVTPLYAFYKSAQLRRRDLTKDHARMLSIWNDVETALTKERRDCTKSYADLRLAQDAKDREEVSETSSKDTYPKLVKKWKDAKTVTFKKFQTFEKSFEKATTLQISNEQVSLPSMLAELEAIERDRLAHMTTYMNQFQQLFINWANELKSASELINTVVPALHPEKAMSSMLDKFTTSFGPPPPMVPVRFDLPCTAAAINADTLPPDSAPMLAYLNGNTAPPTASSSVSSPSSSSTPFSSSFSSPSGATSPSGRSGPPPPPVTVTVSAAQPPAAYASGRVPLPKAVRPIANGNTTTTTTTNTSGPPPPPLPTNNTNAPTPTALTSPPPPPIQTTTAVPPPPPPPSASVAPRAAVSVGVLPPPVPAAASSTPAASIAAKPLPVLGVFKSSNRAPPPSLPQKRKPKPAGEPDLDPSLLPPPPLPPPVSTTSATYRASVSIRRPSMMKSGPPPPVTPMVAVTTDWSQIMNAADSAPPPAVDFFSTIPTRGRVSTAARGPPPLPTAAGSTGTRTSVAGPPPLPNANANAPTPASNSIVNHIIDEADPESLVPATASPPLVGGGAAVGVVDSISSGVASSALYVNAVPDPPSHVAGSSVVASSDTDQEEEAASDREEEKPVAEEDARAHQPNNEPYDDEQAHEPEQDTVEYVEQGENEQQPEPQYAVAIYDFRLDEDTDYVQLVEPEEFQNAQQQQQQQPE